jgi:hypothetical protein
MYNVIIVQKLYVHDVFRDGTYMHAPAPACGRMAHMLFTELTMARWRLPTRFPIPAFVYYSWFRKNPPLF